MQQHTQEMMTVSQIRHSIGWGLQEPNGMLDAVGMIVLLLLLQFLLLLVLEELSCACSHELYSSNNPAVF